MSDKDETLRNRQFDADLWHILITGKEPGSNARVLSTSLETAERVKVLSKFIDSEKEASYKKGLKDGQKNSFTLEQVKSRIENAVNEALEKQEFKDIASQLKEYLKDEGTADPIFIAKTSAMLVIKTLGVDANAKGAELKFRDLKWDNEDIGTWKVRVELEEDRE